MEKATSLNKAERKYSCARFQQVTDHGVITKERTNKGRTLLFDLDMITEDYVSFEIAKLLKEKGFDVAECQNSPHFAYNIDGHFSGPSWDTEYIAPTLQMAMKWLREEKDVQIEILIVETDTWESPTKWVYGFRCQTKGIIARRKANFLSYEEAWEAAIKYALENLL